MPVMMMDNAIEKIVARVLTPAELKQVWCRSSLGCTSLRRRALQRAERVSAAKAAKAKRDKDKASGRRSKRVAAAGAGGAARSRGRRSAGVRLFVFSYSRHLSMQSSFLDGLVRRYVPDRDRYADPDSYDPRDLGSYVENDEVRSSRMSDQRGHRFH